MDEIALFCKKKYNETMDLLNDVQKAAVFSQSRRILILAGAGSGKTHTVISRIIHLIESGQARPEDILALTFSNKAAGEMQQRVLDRLPGIPFGAISIMTFHKLGSYLLRRYGSRLGYDDFLIYSPDESLDLLKTVCPDMKKKDLKVPVDSILEAKDRGFDENSYMEWSGAKLEYSGYFAKYQEAMRKTGNVDFGDLINLPIKLLSTDEETREHVRHRWTYIFVDEYQDTNRMQFELLKLLVGEDTNLCCVGDDDQSIYGFRGAEVEHILKFASFYKDVEVLKLEQNYRSTKNILQLANSLIGYNKSRHKKVLWTENDAGTLPILMNFWNGDAEANFIADVIKKLPDCSSTAIIYRTNLQSSCFETALISRKIPFKVYKGNSFYDREEIKDFISYISFSLNPKDVVSWERIISKPARGIGKVTVARIMEAALEYDTSIYDAVEKCELPPKAKKSLDELRNCMESACEQLGKADMQGYLKSLLFDTGFEAYYRERDVKEENNIEESRLAAINSMKSIVLTFVPGRVGIDAFLENTMLRSSTDVGDIPGVTLSTMHGVKGLEFDNVFVTGLEDELIPSGRGETEEERRLFYVAITRARKNLFLSYATHRKRFSDFNADTTPSRFLKNLDCRFYTEKRIYTQDRRAGYYGGGLPKDAGCPSAVDSTPAAVRKQTEDYLDRIRKERAKSSKVYVKIAKTESDKYKIGDRVFHSAFGISGTIRNIRLIGGHKIVDIEFDDGRKTPMSEGSPLISKKDE